MRSKRRLKTNAFPQVKTTYDYLDGLYNLAGDHDDRAMQTLVEEFEHLRMHVHDCPRNMASKAIAVDMVLDMELERARRRREADFAFEEKLRVEHEAETERGWWSVRASRARLSAAKAALFKDRVTLKRRSAADEPSNDELLAEVCA